MTTLIGLLGGKGAGKDTAARYLCEKLGGKQYAIADELKYLVKGIYGFTDTQLWGTQAEKEKAQEDGSPSPRSAMETVGTALRKVYGDDFQVQRLLSDIATEKPEKPAVAIVSDVRYANEAKFLRGANTRVFGGAVSSVFLIRLQYAPGLRRWPSTHASEQGQNIPVDLEITPGAGGVSELYAALDGACVMLGVGQKEIYRPFVDAQIDLISKHTPYTNWSEIAKYLRTTPDAVKHLALTPQSKCRVCLDDPRGEMIDCAGSLGYRTCPTCTQDTSQKIRAISA